jgi:hypothetical protein
LDRSHPPILALAAVWYAPSPGVPPTRPPIEES